MREMCANHMLLLLVQLGNDDDEKGGFWGRDERESTRMVLLLNEKKPFSSLEEAQLKNLPMVLRVFLAALPALSAAACASVFFGRRWPHLFWNPMGMAPVYGMGTVSGRKPGAGIGAGIGGWPGMGCPGYGAIGGCPGMG